jgi:hypothetical protein
MLHKNNTSKMVDQKSPICYNNSMDSKKQQDQTVLHKNNNSI